MISAPPDQIALPGTDYVDEHTAAVRQRVTLDGKFFRLGGGKFLVKGVAYGPFAPNDRGEPFAGPDQTARDLALIRQLGANLVRVYVPPPVWFLDLALEHELRVFIDFPWNKDACFLDSSETQREIRDLIRRQLRPALGHKGVFAVSVANELPADIVRWSGARPVEDFIDSLVDAVKTIEGSTLCTFGNFPPTEFLRPRLTDFACFNVYLHRERVFENYLARLQMIADSQPLVLGEFGMDSLREGEPAKCALLSSQIDAGFRQGLAGCVVYSFTDEWFKDGRHVDRWEMGLVTRDREPKPSYFAVQVQFRSLPKPPAPAAPKVSVVVASYNGSRTLAACLKSLTVLNYPRYEIILVDDGSSDDTHRITSSFPDVRYVHQSHQGLSVARNTGIAAARGEIIAFTDADCRADEDWLTYTVGNLLQGDCVGMGGHNFLPPDDGPVAAAVMASPGGPAHVMLTDRLAEHIPGCNMVFYKWVLEEIGGFDPMYHRAGDDVDVCWRLQQRGYHIGFSPGGFVWHYRRNNVRDYLRQQQGYGEAEAMLVRRHPEYFNAFGASMWRGRIYGASNRAPTMRRPMIYHGIFGAAWFQTLYQAPPVTMLMHATTLEYHVLVTLPLVCLSLVWPLIMPLAVTSLSVSMGACFVAAAQANLPPAKERFWSRSLITILYFLQPVVRGWSRYRGRLTQRTMPEAVTHWLQSLEYQASEAQREVRYLTANGVTRLAYLEGVLRRLNEQQWQHKADAGWSSFDVEIFGNRWCSLQLITASEAAGDGKYRIKCRLTTVSSLLAKLTLWTTLSVEAMLIIVLSGTLPWVWLSLLLLPAFALYLDKQQKNLRRLVALFLDDIARRHELVKLEENNQPVSGWLKPSDQPAAAQ